MIVLDIETSGLDELKNGIVEVAGLKFENPLNFYHSLCKLDIDDEIDPKALEVNGQSMAEVRDLNRFSQERVLAEFFEWANRGNDFYLAGENVGSFDLRFIVRKSIKYDLKMPFQRRVYDLHTAASLRYEQIFGKLPIENGKTNLGLSGILDFVGLKDIRGKHNALEDVKLEAEAISRIKHSKNLIPEYSEYKIPEYLLK